MNQSHETETKRSFEQVYLEALPYIRQLEQYLNPKNQKQPVIYESTNKKHEQFLKVWGNIETVRKGKALDDMKKKLLIDFLNKFNENYGSNQRNPVTKSLEWIGLFKVKTKTELEIEKINLIISNNN